VAVVDSQGKICGESVTYDHKNLTEEQVLDCIERNIDAAIQDVVVRHTATGNSVDIENVRGKIKGIGLLFPGHIQWPEGRTLTTSNLPGFRDFSLRERMQERTGLPCVADNDANGQTLAEYLYGAGKGIDPLVFMTVSTGIGGGIIIDGKLYRGFTGTAGEFGHMIVDASSDRRCTCGNYGCLMGVASGIVLPEVARRLATELADEGECLKLPRAATIYVDGRCNARRRLRRKERIVHGSGRRFCALHRHRAIQHFSDTQPDGRGVGRRLDESARFLFRQGYVDLL